MKILREMEVGNGKMIVVEVNGEIELRVRRRRKNVCCGKKLGKEKVCEECKKRLERKVSGVMVVFGD